MFVSRSRNLLFKSKVRLGLLLFYNHGLSPEGNLSLNNTFFLMKRLLEASYKSNVYTKSPGKDFTIQSAEPGQLELAINLANWTLFFPAASQKKKVRTSNLPSQVLIHRQLQ